MTDTGRMQGVMNMGGRKNNRLDKNAGVIKGKEKESLSDVAYQAVLQGLFDRIVPVGAFVSQSKLVELLGVPIQPLRDALRVLEAEGVLEIHPRSGIQFLKPDLELIRSTYQFRTLIEKAAVRHFAEMGDAETAVNLLEEHRDVVGLIEKNDIDQDILERIEGLEQSLHGNIIASMNNPLIENTGRRLKNYVVLIRLERLITKPLALRSLKEHIAILEACVARDADRAEAAVADHFHAAMQRILGFI
ncbi:GntR family transcriptional regulator [Hirschia baltica]|nr:GntR family transcriptional regulator [Hirschia baltica]